MRFLFTTEDDDEFVSLFVLCCNFNGVLMFVVASFATPALILALRGLRRSLSADQSGGLPSKKSATERRGRSLRRSASAVVTTVRVMACCFCSRSERRSFLTVFNASEIKPPTSMATWSIVVFCGIDKDDEDEEESDVAAVDDRDDGDDVENNDEDEDEDVSAVRS